MADELTKLRSCARPVVFETGSDDAPFSTAGTCFLAAYAKSVYVVTAKHVVRDWPIDRLHVYPVDGPCDPLPLGDGYTLESSANGSDLADLSFIRVRIETIASRGQGRGNLIPISQRTPDWFPHRAGSTFFFFGYPLGPIRVDYDSGSVSSPGYMMTAVYSGSSFERGCHQIAVNNPLGLDDFNGMSGSPVFCQIADLRGTKPIFAGMLLRGTASSQRAHFIGSARIIDALRAAEAGYIV